MKTLKLWLSFILKALRLTKLSKKFSESESEVAQLCPTLCDPMDCSLPGSSVHGIFQARVLEWIAISFSRGSSRPRDPTQVSRIVDRRFTVWATREVLARCLRHNYQSLKINCSFKKKWSKKDGLPLVDFTQKEHLSHLALFFARLSTWGLLRVQCHTLKQKRKIACYKGNWFLHDCATFRFFFHSMNWKEPSLKKHA